MQPRQVEVPVLQLDLMATPSPAEDLRHVLNKIDAKGLVGLVTALVIVYACSVAIYNLYFSPLAGFPGPKIAAATGYYEFYHDFFKKGKYIFEIEAMHNKYGSIVRVNPHELSIHDPDFYNQLYVPASVRRTDNWSHFGKGIDFDGSHFLTTSHDLHRRRRQPLEPFFSRLGVTRIEPVIAELAGLVNRRFEALKGTGMIIRLDHVFVAFSGDVIGRLCCEDHTDMLEDTEFTPQWFNLLHGIILAIPLFMGFPFITNVVSLIPERFVAWMDTNTRTFMKFKEMAKAHIVKAKRDKASAVITDDKAKIPLFNHIVNSDMPGSELSTDRLAKEAQVLLGAGSASSARTLDLMVYYVLADPRIRTRLQEELSDVMSAYPDTMPSWAELEKLPYLQAVIKEGLRLSYGVMHRLPRCSPDVPIQYKQWTIPRNVPVGMSAYLMHTDPTVYPDPFQFNPDRWLGEVNPLMERNLVPFSRGSRNCLGMNLASAEINILLAVLFRPRGPFLELFDTDETDVIQAHDYLLPLPKLNTKGVRVTVKPQL